jgi:hypothetical protein
MSPTLTATSPVTATGSDRPRSWGSEAGEKTLDEVLTIDQHQSGQADVQRSNLPRYPGSDDSEHIVLARWDVLRPAGPGSDK